MQATYGTARFTLKIVLTLSAAALLIYASFVSLKSSIAAPITLSGTCGGVFNLRTSADGPLANGDTSSINAGSYMNFTNRTISFALTDQTIDLSGDSTFTQQFFLDRAFTLIADPELPDAYQMTIPAGAGLNSAIIVRLIPVNSGNTILIQGKSLGATGMCQKV
jgi:hypothetical protein